MIEKSALHPDTGVSLFFDGLMISCFTKDQRCQFGIYTGPINQDHFFSISVYDERKLSNGALEYKQYDYLELRKAAPLWLYVDLGNGRQKNLYSATRFAPADKSDPRSFDHVLDFDGTELHGPPDRAILIPEALSILNVLQGLFYAADLGDYQRLVGSGHSHDQMKNTIKPMILPKKSTLIGAQIALPKKDGLCLKMEASSGEEMLSVPLETGVRYTVYLEHFPKPPTNPDQALPSHFERFYDAIKSKSGIRYEIIEIEEPVESRCPPEITPCTSAQVSLHDNLEMAE